MSSTGGLPFDAFGNSVLGTELSSICINKLKYKETLERNLKERRSVKDLINQGILLNPLIANHDKVRQLQRARTSDYLKYKIQNRPDRETLIDQRILKADKNGHLLEFKKNQLKLDLNQKLSQRPGSLELVEKGVLQLGEDVDNLIKHGSIKYPRVSENAETMGVLEEEPDHLQLTSPPEPPPLPPSSATTKSKSVTSDSYAASKNFTMCTVKKDGFIIHHYNPIDKTPAERQKARIEQQEKYLKLQDNVHFNPPPESKAYELTEPVKNLLTLLMQNLNLIKLRQECRHYKVSAIGSKLSLIQNLLPWAPEILRRHGLTFSVPSGITVSHPPVDLQNSPDHPSVSALVQLHQNHIAASQSSQNATIKNSNSPLFTQNVNNIGFTLSPTSHHSVSMNPQCQIDANNEVINDTSNSFNSTITNNNNGSNKPSKIEPNLKSIEELWMRIRTMRLRISSLQNQEMPQSETMLKALMEEHEQIMIICRLLIVDRLDTLKPMIATNNQGVSPGDTGIVAKWEHDLLEDYLARLNGITIDDQTEISSCSSGHSQQMFAPVFAINSTGTYRRASSVLNMSQHSIVRNVTGCHSPHVIFHPQLFGPQDGSMSAYSTPSGQYFATSSESNSSVNQIGLASGPNGEPIRWRCSTSSDQGIGASLWELNNSTVHDSQMLLSADSESVLLPGPMLNHSSETLATGVHNYGIPNCSPNVTQRMNVDEDPIGPFNGLAHNSSWPNEQMNSFSAAMAPQHEQIYQQSQSPFPQDACIQMHNHSPDDFLFSSHSQTHNSSWQLNKVAEIDHQFLDSPMNEEQLQELWQDLNEIVVADSPPMNLFKPASKTSNSHVNDIEMDQDFY